MDDQVQELESFRAPKRKSAVWPVIIVIAVMAGLSVTGYYYLDKQYTNEKKELSDRLTALTKQAEGLVADSGSVTNDLSGLSDEPLDPNLTTKEFISTKLGITLRYPKAYFALEIGSGANTYLIIDKKAVDSTIPANSEFPQQYFMISKLGELCGLSSVKSMAVGEKIVDVKIAEKNGWKFTMTKPSDLDGSYSTNYYFNSSSDCYHISLANSNAKGTHDTEIDDIISSITINE